MSLLFDRILFVHFSSLYFSGLFIKYLLIYPLLDLLFEPPRDKTNKMACAPSEDSDQPGHPPSLIRVFAVRMKKAWTLSCPLSAQRRLWSDWADAQADLSLRWAHSHNVGFCHEAAHFIYLLFILSEFLQHNSTSIRIYDASSTTTLRLKFSSNSHFVDCNFVECVTWLNFSPGFGCQN